MNKITHKIAIWRLGRMMTRASKLEKRIERLAAKIEDYERPRFMVFSRNS